MREEERQEYAIPILVSKLIVYKMNGFVHRASRLM